VRFALLKALTLKTGRAWALKESLRELWQYTRVGWAERHWKRWYFWAKNVMTWGRWRWIVRAVSITGVRREWVAHRITNAVTEGLNSKIQTIKKMAYGFRNREHFKAAIYCHCGDLNLYPTTH
jgi:transposase